ncbi:(Fe-S)-binding protein [Tahibacter caeni]|uniref:(Fe-S)-binding protein n=1 Tax=Tahibacter caeni TaxID=1453545 RepID=UPI002147BF44|nr:(Fe-S)-binding protein [Tahibacter caeni]
MSASPPDRSLAADLVELADQCVLCGLCLPVCPTYRVTRTEAESPRGRISLIKALAEGALAPGAGAAGHLERCLSCLSCERACPSGVQYGRLLSLHREKAAPAPDRQQYLLYAVIARPRLLRALARIGHWLGLARWLAPLARRSRPASGWRRWIAQIPPLPSTAGLAPATHRSGERGRVGLFLGCVASAFDRDTHAAARRLLGTLGYRVVEPAGQGCCGALALQAGHRDVAGSLAASTRRAFAGTGVTTVLVSASGCHAGLCDALAGDGIAVREIGEFLAADARFADLAFAPLAQRVAVHRPCSLVNTVRAATAPAALLRHIPGIELVELPEQPRCCGAAGSHFLRHAAIADPLRDERLDQFEHSGAGLLATSNIGCRLHLANGLRERGRPADVLHPITLLARQLKDRGAAPTPPASRDAGAR